MTSLLEIREYCRSFYSKYSQIVTILAKFVVSLTAILMLNGAVGANETLSGILPALLVALLSSLFPSSIICLILGLFTLAQLFSISLPVFAVGFVVFLVLFLLYFRFSPKDGLLVVLTPICCELGIPYILPISAGLLYGPASVCSIMFGLVIEFMLKYIHNNEATLSASSTEEMLTVVTQLGNGIFRNPTMIIMIIAFGLSTAVVYSVRRLRIANAWLIASGTGALTSLIVLIIGGIAYDTELNIGFALLGTIVSLLLAAVITFFFFNLDYSRIESLQFEDDDYYYYVKAVPKVSIETRERTVKTISRNEDERSSRRGRNSYRREEPEYPEEEYPDRNYPERDFQDDDYYYMDVDDYMDTAGRRDDRVR